MDILEYFFENTPANDRFYPRKLSLPHDISFHLYGARGCGKTALVLDYIASSDKETLYIDCQDPIFAMEDIDKEMLEEFIAEEGVELLVLDHWYEGFLQELPSVRSVVVSRSASSCPELPGYELFALDYEEFMAFGKAMQASQGFNHFLKAGSLPSAAALSPASVNIGLRRLFFEKFDETEGRVLMVLSRFQGRRVSAHQIYSYAREYFRISKDSVYATLNLFRREGIVFFIDEYGRAGGKKMYIYDFVLSRYLGKYQSFPVTFDSMVVLALIKHAISFSSIGSLGYLLQRGSEVVLPAPFDAEVELWKRIQMNFPGYREHGVQKISIVTVSERYSFEIEGLKSEAMPFYEWSILNEE